MDDKLEELRADASETRLALLQLSGWVERMSLRVEEMEGRLGKIGEETKESLEECSRSIKTMTASVDALVARLSRRADDVLPRFGR